MTLPCSTVAVTGCLRDLIGISFLENRCLRMICHFPGKDCYGPCVRRCLTRSILNLCLIFREVSDLVSYIPVNAARINYDLIIG